MKIKIWTGVALAFLLGYSAAILLFSVEDQVDYRTGRVRSVYKIFPLERSKQHYARAFDLLFAQPLSDDPEWKFIAADRLVRLMRLSSGHGDGYLVAQAGNKIAMVMSVHELSECQRACIASEFVRRLNRKGTGAAGAFADDLKVRESVL